MPAHARSRRLLALMAALILAATLGATVSPPAAVAQLTAKPRVLVLRGGDAASDAAVIQALEDRNLEVVSGPESIDFAGAPGSLSGIDVVVVLYNANASTPLIPAGISALDAYVNQGGSIVAGEWVIWRSQLAPLMPAIHCGWNSATSTTYSRVVPNPGVDEDVPASFPVSLANFSGTESCLQPKDEATVLYSSSNGGGRSNSAGLLAWNVGAGRVAAFSTTLSATELQSAAYRTLFQNTVEWIARTRDTTPPKIKSFVVEGAGRLVASRELQIRLTASDSGGSGARSYFIREFGFSGDPSDGWSEEAATTAWQAYRQPGADITWTLSDKPGVRYLQAFVADGAGNITRSASVAVVNYSPPQASLGAGELHIYRIAPPAGAQATVRMEAAAGDPDLYVFGQGVSFGAQSAAPVEQTSFTAQGDVYQLEVEGYVAGSYSLAVTGVPNRAAPPRDGDIELSRRPRISVTAISPAVPPDDAATLPEPPVGGTAGLADTLYLPLLRR